MDIDVAAWEKQTGRPLPRLMARFFAWLAPLEVGDLGNFAPAPHRFSEVTGRDGMQPWTATTWGFLRLPDGAVAGLCEAVQPPAVVRIGADGACATIADSFDAFLWAICSGTTGTAIDPGKPAARKAVRKWLRKNRIVPAPVSGPFDFSAYAAGYRPERQPWPPGQGGYPDYIEGMGGRLRMLCSLIGRRGDDPALRAVAGYLFGKAPPQSIGNVKTADTVWLKAPSADVAFLFSRKVLNRHHAPVRMGKKAMRPILEGVFLGESYSEPVLFGLHGDAVWEAIARRLPQHYKETIDEDGERELECTLLLDAARGIELRLWKIDGPTSISIQIAQGRELASPERAARMPLGVGLFMQWALEHGWLERSMFPGQEALTLINALPRGLWDTHLRDVPGLRQFAFLYFRPTNRSGIDADLDALGGEHDGDDGHAGLRDALFSAFSTRFTAWKHANPQELS